MEKKSIADKLGWGGRYSDNNFCCRIGHIRLSPIFGGLELGSVKVPKLPDSLQPAAMVVGPTATVGLLLLCIPFLPLRGRNFTVVLDKGVGGFQINRKLDDSPGGGAVLCHLHSRWWLTPGFEKPMTIAGIYIRERNSDDLGATDFHFLDDKGNAAAPKEFSGTTQVDVRGAVFVEAGVKNRKVDCQLVFEDVRGKQVETPWLRFSYNEVAVIG